MNRYCGYSATINHSKIDKANIFMTNGSLMKVESFAFCRMHSAILLIYKHGLENSLFESVRFTPVLLYLTLFQVFRWNP